MKNWVTLLILNYNGISLLQKFLKNIKKYSSDAQIIVVDNHSTDGSVHYLEKEHKDIKIIHLDKNYGFAEGYNRSISQVKTKYTLLLNSDIDTTTLWIPPLVALMESDKKIAVCQPKILSYQNPHYFDYAGAGGGFIDNMGIPFCRGRIFHHIEKDEGQYDDEIEIFWASGACMLLRTELFPTFQFDSSFFMHMEEIDLCWDLKNAGYKIYYCGKTHLYHMGGGSLSKQNPKKLFFNVRNSLVMLDKKLQGWVKMKVVFIRLIFDGSVGVCFFFMGKWGLVGAIIQGHIAYYYYILKKRRKKEEKRNSKKSSYVLPKKIKYIFFQYFFLKRKKFIDLK